MRRLSVLAMLLTALGPMPAMAAQAARPCVTDREAEALAAVAMPEIIRGLGQTCATRLPATALIRRPNGPFLAKYQAAADAAWPSAKGALAKVLDDSVVPMLDSELARPLLTSLLVPQLIGQVDPVTCPAIDKLATLLQPLPARSTAGVIVVGLKLLQRERDRGNPALRDAPSLMLCPIERP